MKTRNSFVALLCIALVSVLATSVMRAQNVGIGTDTPSQQLDVNGNIKLGNNMMVEGDQSSIKVYRNLASSAYYSGTAGAFAIHTNQPVTALQWAMVIEGYVWSPLRLFRIYLAGFEDAPSASGCIYEGAEKLPVRIGREGSNLAVVIGDTTTLYAYPQITVTEFHQCYINLDESYADGWSISIVSTLSAFTGMDLVPERAYLQWAENGNNIYRLSGNVGIGLNNPASPLEVRTSNNTAGSRVLVSVNESTGTATDQWAIRGEVRSTATQTAGGGILGIHNSTTGTACGIRGDTYSPAGTGIFGVGWATSGASIATRGFNLSPDGYGGHFVGAKNYFSGNLGIGIENPAYKLHVRNGAMMLSDDAPFLLMNMYELYSNAGIQFLRDSLSKALIYYGINGYGRFIKLANSSLGLYNDLIIDTLGHIGINTEFDDVPERLNVGGTSRTGVNSSTDEVTKFGVYGVNTVNNHFGVLGSADYGVEGHMNVMSAGTYGVHGFGPPGYTTVGGAYSPYNSLGGVKGSMAYGSSYVFGVAGFSDFYDVRTGGCLGAQEGGMIWGCLGYRTASSANYGGYFTSSTTGTGDETGRTGVYRNNGIGAYGELFGADIHGDIYGTFTEGSRYGLFSKGDVYRTGLDVHLQEVRGGQAALYSQVSTEVTVQTSGIAQLSEGRCAIVFDPDFRRVVSDDLPVIVTVTPIGESGGLHLERLGPDGFTVQENQAGRSDVQFTYIAIGRRKGLEDPQPAAEVVAPDYTEKLAKGMHNDNDPGHEGAGLYYQDGRLLTGAVEPGGGQVDTESPEQGAQGSREIWVPKEGEHVRR